MIYELAKYRDMTKTEDAEDLAAIAEELGLEVQARRYRSRSVEASFIPMTGDELTIWRAYCPTRYWAGEKAHPHLKNYAFDTIPPEVLRHWKAVRDNFAFDEYEIRTTERTEHRDPLLIGVHGAARHLLARWGEESPGLLSLQEIARRLLLALVRGAWGRSSAPFRTGEALERLQYWEEYLNPEIASAKRILGLGPITKDDIVRMVAAAK